MNELLVNSAADEKEKYELLAEQLKYLISADEPLISGVSNFTAALKQSFDKFSWVGFYFKKGDKLFLGPFQGNTACVEIKIGEGVCGTSALKKEAIIIGDVSRFTGHIACDSNSKSEIVIPLIIERNLIGVLDIDSYELNAFNSTDKFFLEKMLDDFLNKFNNLLFTSREFL